MVKSAEAMCARARARKAKAGLDAQRAEQDRLVVDATTEFYEGAETLAAAQTAAAAAERQRVEAVAKLAELGQTVAQIATLCGISAKEVRDLRRTTTPKTPTPQQPRTETPAGEQPARQQAVRATAAA